VVRAEKRPPRVGVVGGAKRDCSRWGLVTDACGCSQRAKPPHRIEAGALGCKSLTMTYFHRRMPTIIGAKAFHGPVRDGKAWDHLAMVVKRKRLPARRLGRARPIWARSTRKVTYGGVISMCGVIGVRAVRGAHPI